MSKPITLPGKSAQLESNHPAFRNTQLTGSVTAAIGFESYGHVLTNRPLKRRNRRDRNATMPHEQPQETEPAADTPTREQRLEAALREIEDLAEEYNHQFTTSALAAIANKCREALTTGEGE